MDHCAVPDQELIGRDVALLERSEDQRGGLRLRDPLPKAAEGPLNLFLPGTRSCRLSCLDQPGQNVVGHAVD
eukprot:8334806-Pyramimonas_sp.AAC.1